MRRRKLRGHFVQSWVGWPFLWMGLKAEWFWLRIYFLPLAAETQLTLLTLYLICWSKYVKQVHETTFKEWQLACHGSPGLGPPPFSL